MDTLQLIDALQQAFITAATLVAPILLVALVVGALTSLLQAITQVHDQAISFVPKLIVVGVAIFALMPWMTDYYVAYVQDLLLQIPSLVLGG